MDSLKASFENPTFWVNSPGRVNIIGEHTDHQFYGVLPTCINRSIKIVGKIEPTAEFLLKITNTDSSYPDLLFKTFDDFKTKPSSWWGNYAVAAYVGLMEYMSTGIETPTFAAVSNTVNCRGGESPAKLADTCKIPKGITLKCCSDLPAAAGVSSSSALTVALIRALIEAMCQGPGKEDFLAVHNTTELYKPSKIAEFSVTAENHCGTASGGMDQAIICLGNEGIALNINFEPLTTNPVDLPKGMSLIVANTGRKSAKAEQAPFMYNKRVFELRLGNLLLLESVYKTKGEEVPKDICDPAYLPRLRDVERRVKMSMPELVEICKANLKDEYKKDELIEKFGKEKIDNILKLCGEAVLEKNETFRLKQCIVHVFTETIRVNQFVDVCKKAKANNEDPKNTSAVLGKLMNESHYSLRDDFDNSCVELEALTKVAREAGAYGARMTGAGWGGCCVISVEDSEAEKVKKSLISDYYVPIIKKQLAEKEKAPTCLPESENIDAELLQNSCFVVAPANGCRSGTF